MTDHANRRFVTFVGFLALAGGALTVCLGAQVFGTARAHRHVFDRTVVRWWEEGGWVSFAIITAIGVVAVALGLILARAQLHRNDGRQRTPTVIFPPVAGSKGQTSLHSPALSHGVQADLRSIPDVHDAMVGLFGHYPAIEMRAVLAVGDNIDLDGLPGRVDAVLARVRATTGVRPDPVQVTLRFKSAPRQRQLA
jgi:hypothetical protein